jgi:WD40 repeat protein
MLYGHSSKVWVSFSSDGSTLASGSQDGAIKLWNVSTGERIAKLVDKRPYDQMNITGASGLTKAQKASLKLLGAYETVS